MRVRRIIPTAITLPLAVGAALCAQTTRADNNPDLLNMDLETLMTIKVGASADASAKGLSEVYAGNQIANGGRIGILGNLDALETPFSVTHYTHDFIQQHQAASVGDVLQYDPSVRVARGFGNFQQVYKVRGLPIFSDDMTYNGLYGILPRQYLASEAIERVEILRGANSFLNGAAPGVSGGLGGTVDVIPKRAPKEDLAQVTIGGESDQQHYTATDLALRSKDGSMGIRFNAVDSGGDTAVDDASKELGLAVLGADYRSGALRLSADLGYQSHRMQANQPSITIADALAIPKAPNANDSFAQPWAYSNTRDVFGTLRAEYDFTKNITGWIAGGTRTGTENSDSEAFLNVFDDAGDFSGSRFDVIHKDSVNTGEVGLRIQFDTHDIKHKVTLALSEYDNNSRNAYAIYNSFNSNIYRAVQIAQPTTIMFSGGKLNNPLITTTTKTSSLALADTLSAFNNQLLITLGARNQTIAEYNFLYDTGTQSSSYDEQKLTPMAAVIYKLSPQLSLYANYMEGLLKGDVVPATNAAGIVANAGESLKPYSTKQIEAGVKYDAGAIGLSAGLFHLQKPIAGYSIQNKFELNNEQTHQGLDISLYGQPSEHLTLLAGASFLTTDLDNKNAIGAPKIQANIDVEWSLPQLPGFTLNSHWMYTGEQFTNASNTQKVPAWNRMDLGMGYTTKISGDNSLSVHARLENIANNNYWSSVGGFPGASYLTLGNPRTFVISATLNF